MKRKSTLIYIFLKILSLFIILIYMSCWVLKMQAEEDLRPDLKCSLRPGPNSYISYNNAVGGVLYSVQYFQCYLYLKAMIGQHTWWHLLDHLAHLNSLPVCVSSSTHVRELQLYFISFQSCRVPHPMPVSQLSAMPTRGRCCHRYGSQPHLRLQWFVKAWCVSRRRPTGSRLHRCQATEADTAWDSCGQVTIFMGWGALLEFSPC